MTTGDSGDRDPGPQQRWTVFEDGPESRDARATRERLRDDHDEAACVARLDGDPVLGALVHRLRRPTAIGPALDARVMAAVATLPRPERAGTTSAPAAPAAAGSTGSTGSAGARAWRWLRRTRTVRLSPLGGLLGAGALAAAAALLLAVQGGGAPAAPDGPTLAAGDAPTAASPAAVVDTVQVVQFLIVAPAGARTVALVGDFNDWDVGATPLRAAGAGGLWTVEVPLAAGRHRYAFVVDDATWLADPSAPRAAGSDFGTPSSVVTVSEARS